MNQSLAFLISTVFSFSFIAYPATDKLSSER